MIATQSLEGKVAFITGAARGQGRSHAIALAGAGADIIALDICGPIESVSYELPTRADLEATASAVEALDRRCAFGVADVRDIDAMSGFLRSAVADLGRLDIVVANAGIGSDPYRAHELPEDVWQEMLDVNLTGVWHTCKAAIPHILAGGMGGSVVLISSAAGLKGYENIAHYVSAKHGVVGLMRTLANELAPDLIRVNSIHPTQVNTPMIMNDKAFKLFRPDLEDPKREDFAEASQQMHALPIPWAEPADISAAVWFLASDASRLITGVTLPIDAGLMAR